MPVVMSYVAKERDISLHRQSCKGKGEIVSCQTYNYRSNLCILMERNCYKMILKKVPFLLALLTLLTLKMEAVRPSETSVKFYQIMLSHIQEDSTLSNERIIESLSCEDRRVRVK